MRRFVEGEDRSQQALLPASLEDYIDEENPVRVVDAFIDELGLADCLIKSQLRFLRRIGLAA